MSKISKIFAAVLCLVLALTILSIGAFAATEEYVEFTADSLGLAAYNATAESTTVGGITVEWMQLASYGDGIQMRDSERDGEMRTSMLWNTSAAGTGITKIELTYSDSKNTYDNTDIMIINFGETVKGADYTTKLSTTAGNKTYTITPNSDTYDFFYIEWDSPYSGYWVSIKVYYNGCEHNWLDATCTEPKTCSECGETEGEALGHSWVAADCDTPKTCSACGATEEATGHSWVEANCVAPKTCSVCGLTEGNIGTHNYVGEVFAPTCTGDGFTMYTCSGCGDSFLQNEVAATGHSWQVASYVAPTCTGDGFTVYTCSGCGDSYLGDEVAATGHQKYSNGFCEACDAYEPAKPVDGVYEIYNAGQLYWFASQVNGGATEISGKLMADITVNTGVLTEDGELNGDGSNFRVWTPMGNSSRPYGGIFDGNGKTVSGLYVNNSSASYVGLFGYAVASGIWDVGVEDSYFRGNNCVGGVVGYFAEGTVRNCHSAGRILGYRYLGGVIGYVWGEKYTVVNNCSNSGNVSGYSFVGGVAGDSYYGTVENCYNTGKVTGSGSYVGGVVGCSEYGTVSNCYNTGKVTGSGSYVGGVVGYQYNYSYSTVSDCTNNGEISGYDYVGGVVGQGKASNCYNTGSVSGWSKIGGIVGSGNATNCYNTGDVTGRGYVGGVIGLGNPTDCYNEGSVTGTRNYFVGGVVGNGAPTGCYNTGDVTSVSDYVGGVAGSSKSNTVTDCYNTGNVTGGSYVGGVSGSGSATKSYNSGNVSGVNRVGGVMGNGSASNSFNTGSVTGSGTCVGGVTGYVYGSGIVYACYNTGTVTGSSYYVGSIVGHNDYSTVMGCYYLFGKAKDGAGTPQFGFGCDTLGSFARDGEGTVSKNAAAFASGEVAYLLQEGKSTEIWGQAIGTDNVPTLGGAKVYKNEIIDCVNGTHSFEYSNTKGESVAYHVWVDATCTSPKSCSVCGATEGDALGHSWTIPDCDTPKTCSVCGATEGEAGHKWVEATCVAPKTCSTCGLTEGDALGHDYICTKYEPNCTQEGFEFYACTQCGDAYFGEETPPLGHQKFVDGFCSVCGGYEAATLVDGVYEIANAGQLYWFAKQVNVGFNDIDGKLVADIVVNTGVLTEGGELNGDGSNFREWTPIGTSKYKYAGTFDGNGKTVSGLYFNNSSASYVGLFGCTNEAGIRNVGVENSYFRGKSDVGGVVGSSYGTVSNCYNTGTVSVYSDSDYQVYVGGVVGWSSGTVSNCYNTGTVSGYNNYINDYAQVGGVVGRSSGTVSNCYNTGNVSGSGSVGGVTGGGSPTGCYNEGSVTGGSYVGGVTGGGSPTDCHNGGSVTGRGNYVGGVTGSGSPTGCYNEGSVTGRGNYVGGVTGSGSPTDCHNGGSVTGNGIHVGGVTGYGSPTGCYNEGSVTGNGNYVGGVTGNGSPTGCYNTGSVTGNGNYVGGVTGNGSSTECYNTGNVTGNSSYVGGVVGSGSASNSYNTGKVTGSGTCIGGVAGYMSEANIVFDCYNAGSVTGGSYYVGSIVGQNDRGTVSNCYYIFGNAKDGSGTIQFGIGCSEQGAFVRDTLGETARKTASAFVSGEVCYLLQKGQEEQIWGQLIGTDDSPVFSEHCVYLNDDNTYSNIKDAIIPTLNPSYASVSFEDEVWYNLYFTATDLDDVTELGLLVFDTELADGKIEDAIQIIREYAFDGSTYMAHTNGIPAKNMGDSLYFRIYAKLSDESYVYSKTVSYDLVRYAKSILSNSTNPYMKALVVSTLNYGAEAQKYFGYRTDSLMNAFLTEEQQALAAQYDTDTMPNPGAVDSDKNGIFTNTGFGQSSITASFEAAFAMNYYVNPTYTPDGDVVLYYWTEEDYAAATSLSADNASGAIVMTATGSGNQHFGTISGIAAKEMGKTIYAGAVYTSGGVTYSTVVMNYSMGKYCDTIASRESSAQRELSMAAAVYGASAKAYFDYLAYEQMRLIVDAAYALEPGDSLPYTCTLTGNVTEINTEYSTQYRNITVTIVVAGCEDKPIICYRMKGTGADTVKVGDTITVTGIIKNHLHSDGVRTTVEFDSGCTFVFA